MNSDLRLIIVNQQKKKKLAPAPGEKSAQGPYADNFLKHSSVAWQSQFIEPQTHSFAPPDCLSGFAFSVAGRSQLLRVEALDPQLCAPDFHRVCRFVGQAIMIIQNFLAHSPAWFPFQKMQPWSGLPFPNSLVSAFFPVIGFLGFPFPQVFSF